MTDFVALFNYIFRDMLEPAGYLPWGLAAGSLYMILLILIRRSSAHVSVLTLLKGNIIHFLLIIYFAVLLKLALFSREPGSRTTVSFILFDTWGSTMQEHAFFIENIIMFIPFGILIPASLRKMRGIIRCTAAAFICSTLLETIQYITERGFCQLDDIITNTLGGLTGYALYKIIYSYILRRNLPSKPKKKFPFKLQ